MEEIDVHSDCNSSIFILTSHIDSLERLWHVKQAAGTVAHPYVFVVVLSERISSGHPEILENPWD